MLILTYDLRGIFNKEITPKLTKKIILTFRKKFKDEKIYLSYDLNWRSSTIKNFLLQEFNFFEDLQALPSPLFYYWCLKNKKPGIILTASHLPKNYVGFKFILPDGSPWKPAKIKIEKDKDKFESKKEKIVINEKILKEYFQDLKNFRLNKKKFLKFDLKNKFLKTSLPYFRDLNIFFREKTNFSLSSDQDNDRIYFKFQNKKIPLDLIFYFLALDKNYKKLGVPIYFSKFLEKKLKEKNKIIYYLPTGHYFFKKAYQKYKLDLAFEPSGHFYFFKEMKTEAPYLVPTKFFKSFNFSEFTKLIKEIRLKRLSLKFKNGTLENLVYNLKRSFDFKLKRFDGYFLFKEKSFLHLRKSSTEEVLRITLEGENLNLYENFIKKWLNKK